MIYSYCVIYSTWLGFGLRQANDALSGRCQNNRRRWLERARVVLLPCLRSDKRRMGREMTQVWSRCFLVLCFGLADIFLRTMVRVMGSSVAIARTVARLTWTTTGVTMPTRTMRFVSSSRANMEIRNWIWDWLATTGLG